MKWYLFLLVIFASIVFLKLNKTTPPPNTPPQAGKAAKEELAARSFSFSQNNKN